MGFLIIRFDVLLKFYKRNADSKNELRLRVKLESKRDSSIADQQAESLNIMEEDTAQTF